MGSRRNSRNIPPELHRQDSKMLHRAPWSNTQFPVQQIPSPELFDDKLAAQAAELEQLIGDNNKLTTGQLALREEYAAAKGEENKMIEHIRGIRTEGDIEIRILLDKIAKSEAVIRTFDNLKRELQEAQIEARSVMKSKLELSFKVEQATKELESSRENIKMLPEMRTKLDTLKEDYRRLRKTFEYEKGQNIEKVAQMKVLEKDLIGIAGEVERLRTEVSNAGKRANVPIPYGGPHMDTSNLHQHPFYGNGGGYPDGFRGHHLHTVHGAPMQIMNPYGGGFSGGPQVISSSAGGAAGGFAVAPQVKSGLAGGNDGSAWGGASDASHTQV